MFESKLRVYDKFTFFGTQVSTTNTGNFMLHQSHYIRSIKEVPFDAYMESFRCARSVLAWTLHTRPEYACIVNKAAQVTEKTLSNALIGDLNIAIRGTQRNLNRGLNFRPIDQHSMHLRVYTNASFASNDDLTSHLGHLILLSDSHNLVNVTGFASRKSKRIVRPIMGEKLYVFMHAFASVVPISVDLRRAFARKIPILCSPIPNKGLIS